MQRLGWQGVLLLMLSVAGVFAIGYLDWLTGKEMSLVVAYFLPVSVAAWYGGLSAALALAVLSALVWIGADQLAGNHYSSQFMAVWNTLVRLLSFLAIGIVVAHNKKLLDQERQTSTALRESLSRLKVLEVFLPICAQCKKIRTRQGVWQPIEAYLRQVVHSDFKFDYCPDCMKQTMQDAGLMQRDIECLHDLDSK